MTSLIPSLDQLGAVKNMQCEGSILGSNIH